MDTDGTVPIFFVHSPITYTLARATAARTAGAPARLIGARGISGEDFFATVPDDGIWSLADSVHVLEQIALAAGGRDIDLYLPHTAFLLGALVKGCRRIRKIFYLEEGHSSADRVLQQQFYPPGHLDAGALLSELEHAGLLAGLGLDATYVQSINEIPVCPHDATMPSYGGAIATSDDAFPGMPGVLRIALQAQPRMLDASLISMPGLRNRHHQDHLIAEGLQRVLHTCETLLQRFPDERFVLKLHPRDEALVSAGFSARVQQQGLDYAEFCQRQGIDRNLEAAVLNFRHYHFFGPTAQEKYVHAVLGSGRLSRWPDIFSGPPQGPAPL